MGAHQRTAAGREGHVGVTARDNRYLVDVLQRVGQHPASRAGELTLRNWKALFADQPLRSDVYRAAAT